MSVMELNSNERMRINSRYQEVRRGDIYWYRFKDMGNSTQSGCRPVLICSNKMANRHSPILLGVPISTQLHKMKLPTHILLKADKTNGLSKDSFLMAEQIIPIAKDCIGDYIGYAMNDGINNALEISIGLKEVENQYIKNIKKDINNMVREIEGLDIFIQQWLSKDRSVEEIKRDINERRMKVKELMAYCKEHKQNIYDYYNINEISGNKNIRLVV